MPTEESNHSTRVRRQSRMVLGQQKWTSEDQFDLAWFFSRRDWFRQPKPWTSTLPYSVLKTRVWPSSYLSEEHTPYNASEVSTTGIAGVDVPFLLGLSTSLDDSRLLAECQNAVFDLVKGQSFQTPVFLAELHKTRDSIKLLAQKASKGAVLLKRFKRNPSRAFREMRLLWGPPKKGRPVIPRVRTDGLASAWLRYRYELMTGIMDVEDSAKLCADMLLEKRPEQVVRANRTAVVKVSPRHFGLQEWGNPLCIGLASSKADTDLVGDGQITVSAWIRVALKSPVVHEMNQWGLLNWPSNIWELIPGSFIADWSLDIGDYLDRLSALAGVDVIDAGYQVYRRVAGIVTAHAISDFFTTRVIEMDPIRFESSVFQRSPWPNPAPVWTPEVRLTTKRLIDAAALFRGITLGRFKNL